jgi:hypothetical protein
MIFELGSITNEKQEPHPAMSIPGVGVIPFVVDDDGFAYIQLDREQQVALKKELD